MTPYQELDCKEYVIGNCYSRPAVQTDKKNSDSLNIFIIDLFLSKHKISHKKIPVPFTDTRKFIMLPVYRCILL